MNNLNKLKVYNPYTKKEVGEVSLCQEQEINELVNVAYKFRYTINYNERASILEKCSKFYKTNLENEAKLISDESGICIKQAIYEVKRTINALNYSKLLAEKLSDEDFQATCSAG